MQELGYRPSPTARNLSLGRTQTLGVIAPFFTSPSVVERLRGIDDVVGRSAYDLTLFNIETLDQRRAALRRFARRDRVDGVIVISLPLKPAEIRALHRDRVPTVLVDVAHALLPNVAIDDVAGGALAARHLVEAGHGRIAFVGDVEDNPFAFASSQRRLEGMRRALHEAGVALPASYVRRGPFGRETALALTRELLALRRRPSAIFAASDVQAFGVLDAAARAGLAVPGDLSVIGFDDIELAAAIGLTTVRQPLRESGRAGGAAAAAGARRRGNVFSGRRAGRRCRSSRSWCGARFRNRWRNSTPNALTGAAGALAWNRFHPSAGPTARSVAEPARGGTGHANHHPPHPLRRGHGRRRPAAPIRPRRRSRRARGARRAHAADHAPPGAPLSPHRLRRGPRAGRRAGADQGARALRSRLRHRLRPLRRADHDRRDAPLAARPHVGRAPAARGGRDVARAAVGHRAPERDARPRADHVGPRRAPRPLHGARRRGHGGAPWAVGAVARRPRPRRRGRPDGRRPARDGGRGAAPRLRPRLARRALGHARAARARRHARCTSPATCPSARSPGAWACRR